jgi:hypothetical protein
MTRLTALFLVVAGCATPATSPLRLKAEADGAHTRLTLIAQPGWKVNARLKPALELIGGGVVRFDSPHLTADSAYFAEPPTAVIAGPASEARGKLRASVCQADETVCRTLEVDL